MQSLSQATREAATLDTDALIQYIIDRHHQRERYILSQLEDANIQACEQFPQNSSLYNFYKKFTHLHQALLSHFEFEEQKLYPQILKGAHVNWDQLSDEHVALVKDIKILTEHLNLIKLDNEQYQSKQVDKMIEEFENFAIDVHHHMFLENMVLSKR